MTGQVTTRTTEILDRVRLGTIEGILHYLIVYELSYHWRRGRLPFKDERELLEFIHTYFTIRSLDPGIAVKASQVKIMGDDLLSSSGNPDLQQRRSSVADATTIVLAEREIAYCNWRCRFFYVARTLGIDVIW